MIPFSEQYFNVPIDADKKAFITEGFQKLITAAVRLAASYRCAMFVLGRHNRRWLHE